MGHAGNAKNEVYHLLAQRLNRNPVGTPVNETLMSILHRLYTEGEAIVAGKFSLFPMTLERVSGSTGIAAEQLKPTLDSMAQKGLVIDVPRKEATYYLLSPMVVGFFEYTFMRVRDDVDMKSLAELFQAYFQDRAVIDELTGSDTKIERTLVYESLIPLAVETEVLNYERASEIIRKAGRGSLSLCACRHKASHLGKACGAPLEVCTSLGFASDWVVHRGMGKPATVDELLRVLDRTEKLGLVHNCDNVLNHPTFICHCCGCCCVVLSKINEFGKYATHPSNFIPQVESARCAACGICANKCHVRAISMHDEGDGTDVPVVNEERCLGCAVCASSCPTGALTMARRLVLHIPPANAKEKFLRIAREKGRI
jgi:Pyruvate/2-oxoacid:ferredoxin oxidoreductase delta subunit